MKKTLFILSFLSSEFYFSQVGNVGINTSNPESTLDIHAKNHLGAVSSTDGILVPRVASLGTNGTVNGQLVYLIANSGAFTQGFHYWDGAKWLNIDKSIYSTDGIIPSSTNRTITLGDRSTSKLTIAPTGEESNTSILNVIGGNAGGGITSGITVASNNQDNTSKVCILKGLTYANGYPVQMMALDATSGGNKLLVGGVPNSSSQGVPTQIDFTIDGDTNLENSGLTSFVTAMTIIPGGNVGIGTSTPSTKLEIGTGIAGDSGLQFSNLTASNTPAIGAKIAPLGVDGNGNVVSMGTSSSLATFSNGGTVDVPVPSTFGCYRLKITGYENGGFKTFNDEYNICYANNTAQVGIQQVAGIYTAGSQTMQSATVPNGAINMTPTHAFYKITTSTGNPKKITITSLGNVDLKYKLINE